MKKRNNTLVKYIPAVIGFGALMYLMLLPGKKIPKLQVFNELYFDKWVHAGVFAMFMFLVCYPYYRSTTNHKQRLNFFIKVAVAVSIWGLMTEFMQKYFVPGRTFDLMDWAADILGVLVGIELVSEFKPQATNGKLQESSF